MGEFNGGNRSPQAQREVGVMVVAILTIVGTVAPEATFVEAQPAVVVVRGAPPAVRCTGGADLSRVLRIPKVTGASAQRLVPGILWTGRHGVAAADTREFFRWQFASAKVRRAGVWIAAGKSRCVSGIYGSCGRVLAVFAKSPAGTGVAKLFQPTRHFAGCKVFSSEALQGQLGARWWTAVAPPALSWLAATSAVSGGLPRLSIWTPGHGPPARTSLLLGEPDNHLFASANGDYLGWVDGGHWVRWAKPGNHGKLAVRRLRLAADAGLCYGALSPRGRRLLLVACHPSPGGTVKLISVRRRSPTTQRTLALWSSDAMAVCACPPTFSPSGSLVAVATFRWGNRWPVGVWVINAHKPSTLCYMRLRGDLPIALAFSPGGNELAVEGWYHIIIFRLPRAFYKLSYLQFHEPHWNGDWTHPASRRLPPQ